MSELKKFFVVIDPTDHKHIALERALITCKHLEAKAEVHVFVGVDPEAIDTRAVNTSIFRDEHWFEAEIHAPLRSAGIKHTIEVSWSSEWQKSIMQSAKRLNVTAIYLPADDVELPNFRRFFFTESKWELLKGAHCPVVLIRPGAKTERKVICAAVNFNAIREVQQQLNTSILETAKHFADLYDAELHVANGYMDSMHYPDRGRLMNETGLPTERIHVEPGYTDEAVSKIAKNIKADLVVMGTLGQNGMLTSRRGSTSERLIEALSDQDVMVINHG
jgi:universal stress protein E